MTFSKTILLTTVMDGEFSRKKAIQVRETVLAELSQIEVINIDLTDANFTPSVADELIGGIAVELGADRFKQHIKIINASDSQRALMNHIIARRLATK